MSIPLPILDQPAPVVALAHLDDLWFQVAGTLCNLTCRHCFISCSPHNHNFGFLGLDAVHRVLDESVGLGVKEYYFTGGEPFLNPDMTDVLELTLRYGPATVLTNGTVFKEEWLQRLARAEAASPYSLEFRVSIDGFTAATNDPVRGPGAFDRALRGVRQLAMHGFLAIITVARTNDEQDDAALFTGFVELLCANGCERPRVKILPTLRLGAEEDRQRGYQDEERVTLEMMEEYDPGRLICDHSRIVSDRGVHVCPILLEAPDARLGATLTEALGSYPLRHHACTTCYQYGALRQPIRGAPRCLIERASPYSAAFTTITWRCRRRLPTPIRAAWTLFTVWATSAPLGRTPTVFFRCCATTAFCASKEITTIPSAKAWLIVSAVTPTRATTISPILAMNTPLSTLAPPIVSG